MIIMRCEECGMRDFRFDERLGEKVCNECGLVAIYEAFDESVSFADGFYDRNIDTNRLGSVVTGKGSTKFNRWNTDNLIPRTVQNALTHCNMILAKHEFVGLKSRTEELYLSLYRKGFFNTGDSLEIRATAIVSYVLKENGTPLTYKEICSEFSCSQRKVRKLVSRITKNLRTVSFSNQRFEFSRCVALISDEPIYHARCEKVFEYFERLLIDTTFNKGRCYNASICWIATNMFCYRISGTTIAEKTGFQRKNIYNQTKKILELIGKKSVKEIKGKDINNLMEK
jgi:hypothetical protein